MSRITDRLKNIEARSASLKVEVNVVKDKITSTQKQYEEVSEFIEPYVKFNLVSHFNSLLSELNLFRQWLVFSAILTLFFQQTEDCFLLDWHSGLRGNHGKEGRMFLANKVRFA